MQASTVDTLTGVDVSVPDTMRITVAAPPNNEGAALAKELAGMVADARNRANTQEAPAVPEVRTPTPVIVQAPAQGPNTVLMLGTLFCVAAAGVTLYQAHRNRQAKK